MKRKSIHFLASAHLRLNASTDLLKYRQTVSSPYLATKILYCSVVMLLSVCCPLVCFLSEYLPRVVRELHEYHAWRGSQPAVRTAGVKFYIRLSVLSFLHCLHAWQAEDVVDVSPVKGDALLYLHVAVLIF